MKRGGGRVAVCVLHFCVLHFSLSFSGEVNLNLLCLTVSSIHTFIVVAFCYC